ncbi:MAG: ABC transporter ATP-binding protein [Lachnospiraceae bacterium]
MAKIMLELKNITKKYGGLYANREINLSVEEAQVYCLLGENGVGKSTLMNVLYGMTKPDEGAIFIDGKQVEINSPNDAIRYGIGMVHQHFMLVPALTVIENIILATDNRKSVFLDRKKAVKRIREISEQYGFKIDPNLKISELTVGQRQRVEIVKAIYHDCRLLIMDEPTAVLTPNEIQELYKIIQKFKDENKSVIFISHKLQEVMYVSDKISVLRNGENVATLDKSETNEQELAAHMVGKEVCFVVNKKPAEFKETVLAVEDLKVPSIKGNVAVKAMNFQVRAGEIYGIAGVDGNGQSELVRAISGLCRAEKGKITILGDDMINHTPGEILSHGVSHIPEDRQQMGILMKDSLLNNLIMHDIIAPASKEKKRRFIDWKAEEALASDMVTKYNVKMPHLKINIENLSGGNQQKAVVARELEKKPKLLLAVHPTRGVDIGAIEFIHKEIVEARDNGCAVLLVSTELDEIMALSDTIGVIYEGQMIGEMDRNDATIEKIGMFMAGVKARS